MAFYLLGLKDFFCFPVHRCFTSFNVKQNGHASQIPDPLLLIFMLPCIFSAKGENRYEFTIDLVNVKNDQVNVSLSCPTLQETTVSYSLPKIVPGTYAIYDFGRFVENFSAEDKEGKPLTFTHENVNTWVISDAEKLDHISYKVNDSFDAYDKSNPVFEPAGSNIQQDTNYVLNTFRIHRVL
jgi:hypothetical protein